MRKIIALFCFISAMVLGMGTAALAQTPDGETPAMETICDTQAGAAFGLCNAYCEAMDCDQPEIAQASLNACERVASNYFKITAEDVSCEPLLCNHDGQCGNCVGDELTLCQFCLDNPTAPECGGDDDGGADD